MTDDAIGVLTELDATWDACLRPQLTELLTPRASHATRRRLTRLLPTGVHPEPRQDGRPAVPWPPF